VFVAEAKSWLIHPVQTTLRTRNKAESGCDLAKLPDI